MNPLGAPTLTSLQVASRALRTPMSLSAIATRKEAMLMLTGSASGNREREMGLKCPVLSTRNYPLSQKHFVMLQCIDDEAKHSHSHLPSPNIAVGS